MLKIQLLSQVPRHAPRISIGVTAISVFLLVVIVIGKCAPSNVPKIQEYVILRNRTVHELAEPKISDAKLFIEVVRELVEKYLEKDFNGNIE